MRIPTDWKGQADECAALGDNGEPDRFFFDTMPDRPQAMSDFANHLKRNWEPRMRRELLQHIEQQGGGDLNQMVLEALRLHGGILK
jgi:formate dehydrogenase subunit delta